MRRAFLVSGIGAIAVLATAAPASAASSDGATVTHQSFCDDLGTAVICQDLKDEYGVTTAPSGNQIFEDNQRYSYTVTFLGGTQSGSGFQHNHTLFRQGQEQEYSNHYSFTVTEPDGTTCVMGEDFHFANGQVQYARPTMTCP
jgi:hypothetical protein